MDEKYIRQFNKGSLEMVLLALIGRGETYGYEIITELNRRGAQVLGAAREGTVYPILYRLQDAGLVRSRIAPASAGGGSRKYYSLTEEGQTALRELTDFWRRYEKCVDSFIGEGAI